MRHIIIDRRYSNGKNKQLVNRRRFLDRYKKIIKEAVENAISKRSIKDIDKGEKISIPGKDISEPQFQHGRGGVEEAVHPGNKQFSKGDQIKRPETGQGSGGSEASNEGEGEDDFVFELSRKEFLELFFEDLELPDLLRKELADMTEYQSVRAGYSLTGTPTNIHIVRSMRQASARRIAITGTFHTKIAKAEEALNELMKTHSETDAEVVELKNKIAVLKRKLAVIPFVDTVDLRYASRIKQPKPSTKAVMFCIMDVSGSMDEAKKEIAKRFFILLYLFLTRNYEHIEIVFIRHHTSAKEVDEQEFFYSRETGGTVVSSALEMMRDIIHARYPVSAWNIYAAQASDGDNWNADSPYCQKILAEQIMPYVQYFAYIEIMPRHHQSLWEAYTTLQEQHQQFAMQHIDSLADIYSVFRELFKRQIG